jgi:hypothetical protein
MDTPTVIKARRRISAGSPGWPCRAFSTGAILERRDGFGICPPYIVVGVISSLVFETNIPTQTQKPDSPVSPITKHSHDRLVPAQLFGDHRRSDNVQSRGSTDVETLFVK